MQRKYYAIILLMFIFIGVARANCDAKPWSVLLYTGGTAKQTFGNVIMGRYSPFGEDLYTIELAYTLKQDNLVRRFLNFFLFLDTAQIATNYTYRRDYRHHDHVNEGDLYLVGRLTRVPRFFGENIEFPWHNYLITTFAIGDGMSYASHPPLADQIEGLPSSDFNRLLNYLMLEVTFAMPSYPNLQLVGRIHHRCTMWGVYPKNINAGSTSVGVGIRYYF